MGMIWHSILRRLPALTVKWMIWAMVHQRTQICLTTNYLPYISLIPVYRYSNSNYICYPKQRNLTQSQAEKGVPCVNDVPLLPRISYNNVLDKIGSVINVDKKFVSVSHKFSPSCKNDPVTVPSYAEELTQMFKYAIPLAIPTEKGRGCHTKPFKVHIFEVMPNSDNIGCKPLCLKGKQGSKYHTAIIYILSKM